MSAIFLPLVSVDLEYHDGWCALKSPRIRGSAVVRRFSNLSLCEVFPDQIVTYADDGCLEKAIDL